MTGLELADLSFREATEGDAEGIIGLFRAAYGDGYVHPQVYDPVEVKRMIFDDGTLLLVAEHGADSSVVGVAGVLFEMGAYSDLVGEFGRLVVHPDWRGRGVGRRFMEERLARVGRRLHVGFAEVRVGSSASPRISLHHGFVAAGALPQKLVFQGQREHAGLLVRHFGSALALRRNHPRIVPEALYLADVALRGVGVEPDVIVDDEAQAYPHDDGFGLEELTDQGYSSLLRIERGRITSREIFGPQRLQYGLFRLGASHSQYIVARDGDCVVGALGYMKDAVEKVVRVFEVIQVREGVVRALFRALERRCLDESLVAAEVDVGADATRMQRTLLELGYVPAAYVPAMAFHEVERIDVVKMYRLFQPLEALPFEAPEPLRSVGLHVLAQFEAVDLHPRLVRLMEALEICDGLTEEQSSRLVASFRSRSIAPGTRLFHPGDDAEEMMLVVSGEASVEAEGAEVGRVGPGECVGEVAFLNDLPHSASVVALTRLEVGVLARSALTDIVRRRPDIGTAVYRNLARGLGRKLRRAGGLDS
jgi:CRP-like cAMP-binding protein/GNAT superfamily N-acetyltransferase